MEIQNPAFGKSPEQRLAHSRRINAGKLCHSQCLGYGVNRLGNDQLIGKLGHLTRTGRSHVSDFFPDHLQNRQRPCKIIVRTTGHDCQICRLGADLTAGNRSIHPAPTEPVSKIFRRRYSGRAEIKDQRTLVHATGQSAFAEYYLLYDIRRGQIQADGPVAYALGDPFQPCGGRKTVRERSINRPRTSIPYRYARASRVEVPGHRCAHIAESDKSDLVSLQVRAHFRLSLTIDQNATPMKIVITGGGGFLGSRLCRKIQQQGGLTGASGDMEVIDQVVLFDAHFSQGEPDGVSCVTADVSDREAVFDAMSDADSIFHLASMVSGECELHFDDALRVNLDGGRNVFEAARHSGRNQRVVFASSIACFGGDLDQMRDTTQGEISKRTPQTTYGMTKVIGELMINDYTRRGFFDGRSARLPTVIIRPGRPNAAASSWASGMFREPLAGEDCELPVHRHQCHPMTGYRTVIDSLIQIHELSGSLLGHDRAIGLPAHCVTPNDAERVVDAVADRLPFAPGEIVDSFDANIQSIVDRWPTAIDGSRAVALGLPEPPPLENIVREYLEDYPPANP